MSDISVGAVGAALIAGLVSFFSLVIGKEQKVSEFRQVWIEDLRKCLISYLVNINALSDLLRLEKAGKLTDETAKMTRLQMLNEASHGIRLRINDKEKAAKDLLKAMSKFELIGQSSASMTPDHIRLIEDDYINASKKLLKFEWKRVKRGEDTFVWSKRIVISIVVALSIIYVSLLIFKESSPNLANVPTSQQRLHFLLD